MLQIREQANHSKLVTDAAAHILLLDSDSQTRQYLTRLLSAHYEIDGVADSRTAFTLARERVPDLILASVMTRVLDGFDLLREFRRDARVREVPIILYSSSADEKSCLEGMEAGANDYVITPLSEHQLLTRVRAQLQVAQICRQSIHALRASEARYRTLATATTVNVWTAAPNGDVIGEAQGWEKMTGQNSQEYRGSSWIDVVHPDDRQRLLEKWQRAVREAIPFAADYRIKRTDGSYGYVRAQGTPVHNSDGSVREWIGTHVDIDEQVRAEEALRTSELEFRANFELAGIGQVQVDPKTGRMLRVNPRFCKMLRYSADELLTMTFLDITHTEDRPSNAATSQPFLRGETGEYSIEKRYVRKDGSILWGLVTSTMIRDAESRPLRTIAMVQDITERRQLEALSQCQKIALEMVAQGAPLADVLQFVVAFLEKQAIEGHMVSILLLDEDGKRVRLGAMSGLPESYCQRLKEVVSVSDLSGPCRVVISERRPVIVADLAADPNWEAFRHLVAPYGFRAAWSTPIISSDQRLLGTFCIYFRNPRTPGPVGLWMIEEPSAVSRSCS